MVRQYEFMMVLRPDYPIEKESDREAMVKKLVGEGFSVTNLTVVGKKLLAYPVRKHNEGIYLLASVSSQKGMSIAEVEKRASLGGDVIRFLITAKEN